jgi:hypothetical protein
MRWDHPLMRIARDLDPRKLKSKAGRPSKYGVDDLVNCLLLNGDLTGEDWKASVKKVSPSMSNSAFYDLRKKALADGLIEVRGGKFSAIWDERLIVACLPEGGLTASEWENSVRTKHRMQETTFHCFRKQAVASGLVKKRGGKFVVVQHANMQDKPVVAVAESRVAA